MSAPAVTAEAVTEAAARLAGHAVETPLLHVAELDALTGGTVLVKAECLQRTGSFKFRGAFNAIAQVPDSERRNGVVAWSSGNHAQAVAAAAASFGVPATIVMPSDAPAPKIANTRALGAEVVLYDRDTQSREEIGTTLAAERGAVIIPPFDDPRVIAGQGTAGLEAVAQARAQGFGPLDAVVAPCSGGGLLSGVGTAVRAAHPRAEVWAAEPAGFDDLARSLTSGRRERNERTSGSLCDALLAPSPGTLTFPVLQGLDAGAVAVTDGEVLDAMRIAFARLKLVLEPGGAAALAAVVSGKVPAAGRTVLVIASGGNVAPEVFRLALSSGVRV